MTAPTHLNWNWTCKFISVLLGIASSESTKWIFLLSVCRTFNMELFEGWINDSWSHLDVYLYLEFFNNFYLVKFLSILFLWLTFLWSCLKTETRKTFSNIFFHKLYNFISSSHRSSILLELFLISQRRDPNLFSCCELLSKAWTLQFTAKYRVPSCHPIPACTPANFPLTMSAIPEWHISYKLKPT